MDLIQLLGLAAAACTTFSFLPQVVHALKTRDTSAISLWMYVIFCAGILLWLVYGIFRDDVAVIAGNAVTLVLAGSVLVLKLKNG